MHTKEKWTLGTIAAVAAVGAMLLASPDADASPKTEIAGAFCMALSHDDSTDAIVANIMDMAELGLTAEQAGDAVSYAVTNVCPIYRPSVQRAMNELSTEKRNAAPVDPIVVAR